MRRPSIQRVARNGWRQSATASSCCTQGLLTRGMAARIVRLSYRSDTKLSPDHGVAVALAERESESRAEALHPGRSIGRYRVRSGRGPARWRAGSPLAVSAVSSFVPV